MVDTSRPNLEKLDPEVRAYILELEAELQRLRNENSSAGRRTQTDESSPEDVLEPSEPPTTINVITATAAGYAKRTPRHLYTRQRRGGMGVFDLDSPDDEKPAIITLAEESDNLILITDQARAFKLPVASIKAGAVRDRGHSIVSKLNLNPGETLAVMLPDRAEGYIAMLSQSGMVRLLRHHIFGDYMKPGTSLYDSRSFGTLVSATWTRGDGDLFIATRKGRAIRFSEKLVPPQGGQGIRLAEEDAAVAIAAVDEDSGVFLLSSDGRGTIRLMEGFNANKAPGAGGKIAINADEVVGAVAVEEEDDIFIITELSKIIRFRADEIPQKEGVVQGVNCITLRSDRPAALAVSASPSVL